MVSAYHRRDIIFFLVLIPIINALNYFITYTNVSLNLYFFVTFLIDTCLGYSAWLLIRFIILELEKKYPLKNFTWQRLAVQLLLTSVLGLSIIVIVTVAINFFARDTPIPNNFYTHDIFIYLVWILVINGIYIGIYYYHIWKTSEEQLLREQELKTTGVTVRIGAKNTKVPLININGFFAEQGATFIIDQHSKTHLVDNSLEVIERNLSEKIFFRVNRKFILKRNVILSYKRIKDGKLVLTISLGTTFPTEIIVSRLKAPSFKKWFTEDVL